MADEPTNDTTEETPEEVSDTSETPEVEETSAEVSDTSEAKPTRSRRHVPRAERRQRTKPVREQAKTRKTITRTPTPEAERGRRQERRGVVVSDKADKTIVVRIDTARRHRRYRKIMRTSVTLHAHDERNDAHAGDTVRVQETRPMSRSKRWRLLDVVERAR